MGSTRRAFTSAALTGVFAWAMPLAGQEATPSPESGSDPVQVLEPAWSQIDLTPYAPGWTRQADPAVAVFARANALVMDGFDLASSEALWSTDLRAAFPEEEFVDTGFPVAPRRGETVAIAHTNGADLFGVDAATGEALWSLRMHDPGGVEGSMSTSFALAGGRIVGVSATSQVYARDERTAELLWTSELPIEGLLDTISPPETSDSAVYLLDEAGHVHAVGLEDGELLWTRDLEADDQVVTLQTFGDAILANFEWDGVRRLAPGTGEDMWSNPDYLPYRYTEITNDGRCVIGISPSMHLITAIDLETGETLWKREPDEAARPIIAQASTSTKLAIADEDHRIVMIDAASGDEVYAIGDLRLALAYPQSVSALAMTDEWLFVSTDNQRITIVDAATGAVVNRTSLIGITDGIVPVDLGTAGDLLLAHAPRLSLATFRIV